jgi:tetratricopeptide (TPR) repeat protein
MIELLLFGLDQESAGIRFDPALTPEASIQVVRDLVTAQLRARPNSAYHWSLASDLYRHIARMRRREMTIDLERLSEDPLENLLPEEWQAVAALERASDLEPNNYLYQDLLAEYFLEVGAPVRAAAHCRRAVTAFPVLREHRYLQRPDLPGIVIEAAIQGFQDSVERESLVPLVAIECDLGRLLAKRGSSEGALEHFARAVKLAPDFYDAHVESGEVLFRQGGYAAALESFGRAANILPDQPWLHYRMGKAHRALGHLDEAIAEFRRARELAPREVRFFQALAEVLEEAGKLEEAERQLRAAANLNPDQIGAWSSLLAFYTRTHNRRSALDVCGRILALGSADGRSRDRCAALRESAR